MPVMGNSSVVFHSGFSVLLIVGVASFASPRVRTRYCSACGQSRALCVDEVEQLRKPVQTYRIRSATPVLCSQISALQQLSALKRARGGVRARTLITFALSTSPGFPFSLIVRFGLEPRLIGTLVGAEGELLPLLWLFLRRCGRESLELRVGRPMLVDVCAAAVRTRNLLAGLR